MGASGGHTSHDAAIAAVAGRQHGLVDRGQLLALGLTAGAIGHRLSLGRLHRVHLGVYAVGHPAVSRRGRWLAAVLACGSDAVLSHRSAAALWGLSPTARADADVSTTVGRRHSRPRIAVHRVRALPPADRSVVDGIPVTSVARTLLDLADVVSPQVLQRALETAERERRLDLRALDELCARSPGRHGLRGLRRALAAFDPAAAETRSELERQFLARCRTAGLPPPAVNTHVAGFEVDMAWPAKRLVVELDGHAFHANRQAFERDRVRDAALQLEGFRVIRVTHRRLHDHPETVMATVRELLDGR